ncbi:hypothetical protein ODJ79_16315 [Actinoplanes sp. KI2]|uniref:hypothetical protein n=1 Tax=Actinoplanes sp. KI2 TaxID=2983315 RepID=UPI0021D5CB80|nr:hypothetical protein [Actinoplanes sp. KI2]MCU7725293.1 hypothetical protein [Actinoplanes sp. KI2]
MSDAAITRPSLIAGESETAGYEGAGIVEAAMGMKDGFQNENYLAGFGNMAVVGLSALGAVMDPFQAVFAAGVGWLMEHLDCLREPMDKLLGDPKEIEGHAATWRNLQKRTYEAAEYFADQVTAKTANWSSEAVNAYRAKASQMAGSTLALGEIADSMAEATLVAGSIVGVFRNTIRDLVAELVGAAISKALQALLVVTIPKVLAEVALMVAEVAGKVIRLLRQLTEAIGKLGSKFPAMVTLIDRITRLVDNSASELAYGSLFLNSSKLHAADSYLSDSQGPWKAYKHAYGTMAQGDAVVYGTKSRVAVDALREGIKMNGIQNGSTTGGQLHDGEPPAPTIELPL